MKKLLVLIFTVLSFSAIGQVYELNNIVRNNTLSPARVANALDAFKPYTATGTDAYAISPGMNVYAGGNTYTTGDIWTVTFTNANTGAATLNVNGDGAITIRNNAGSALSAGEIVAGGTYILAYNGSQFRIVGATGSGGGGAAALGQKTETGTTYTVTDADNNYVIHFSNASGVTVTMPNTVSDDTYITFIRDEGAGVITFAEGGTSVFKTLGNEVTIDEEKAWSSWIKDGATDWYAAGGLGPLGGGGGTWGSITGTLSDQTDLQSALNAKASLTGAETLTNKRLTPRVQSVSSSATVTPNADNDDAVKITAQAAGLTLANPSGTPTAMQAMIIRIKDNGTARSITYGTQYRAIGVTLPTATVISKTLYLGLVWNSEDSKWDVIGYSLEN